MSFNSQTPNSVGIPFDFSFASAAASSFTVYIADIVNPPEGSYAGVDYTVSTSSAATPAPGTNSPLTYVNTTPDAATSQISSSLTPSNPDLTATNNPSNGAVITATIYDSFYNPVAGESIFIGVYQGAGAETAPIGSAPASSGSTGNGEPQTGSNGEAQYYAYGTVATPPNKPDQFFAEDTTSGFFVGSQPPPSEALISIPIVAADPSPPSVVSSLPQQSSVIVTGGTTVSNANNSTTPPTSSEVSLTADGTSTATITISLYDQFGNAVTDQAISLQPIEPTPPAPSENLSQVVITPVDPPGSGSLCDQGPSSEVAGVSCTGGYFSSSPGATQFRVTDTRAQVVSFEITDLTDGYVLPYTSYPLDAPNIPVVEFLAGPVCSVPPSATTPNPHPCSTVTPPSATVIANGSSSGLIAVSLVDNQGNPEVGKVVTLSGNTGSHSKITAVNPQSEVSTLQADGCPYSASTGLVAGTTDCNGMAYFAVSDATVETVTYTATDTTDGVTLSDPTQQPVITFIAGSVSASSSQVSVSPSTVVGDGQGVALVTVTAEDATGHLLDGETVTLNTSSSALASVTVVPGSATTGPSGQATFHVRSSSPIGPVSIPVAIGSTVLNSTANITFAQAPDLANTTVTASPPNPFATGSADETVTVTAKDSAGNPIPGLSLELLGGAVSPTPSTAVTNASGVATFSVGATLPASVTYTVSDLSDIERSLGTVTVNYLPIPDEAHESTVQASPLSTYTYVSGQPASSQSSTVTVTLINGSGSPIVGSTVSLGASSTSAVVTPASAGSQVSNGAGVATFTVTDPNHEKVTFTATDTTTATPISETAQVNFVLRPNENTASKIKAAPTIVEANGTSSAVVTVTLQNNGVLLSGDTVSLSQGQDSSVITTSDPVSNASGQVQFTVSDVTPQTVVYSATDLTTATVLTNDVVVNFTAPPGGSLQPSVTGISPSTGGGTGGTEVTVTGLNFAGATAVYFGGEKSHTFTVNPAGTEIVAVSPIPVAAGSVNITVTGPGGTSQAVAGDVFTYSSAPPVVVTSVTPSSGPLAGGTGVTIAGTGFAGASAVDFG
ncbi:MAG: Ig-like domain-containing protein, partial [Acidimicrobiales bacterium]